MDAQPQVGLGALLGGADLQKKSLVPRLRSQRVAVIFRHHCSPGDIWQCLEIILV